MLKKSIVCIGLIPETGLALPKIKYGTDNPFPTKNFISYSIRIV